jgi:glutaredoxin
VTKAHVTIYSRPGCHLCDDAKRIIIGSAADADFTIEEINIDLIPALTEQFRNDIPVVFINGIKVFKHRVDPSEFRRKLRRIAR